jgi:hypothetical protein
MSSFDKNLMKKIKPLINLEYTDSKSGWSYPDRVTTTREYQNFTVDYVYFNNSNKFETVISHREWKTLPKTGFKRLTCCPEPISVMHPIMRDWDRDISKHGREYRNTDDLPRNVQHYTVLLHQGKYGEKPFGKGYYEVVVTEEYNLPCSERTSLTYDLDGQLIRS